MIGAITILLAGSIAEITASGWKSWLGAAVLVRLGVGLAQSTLITYVSELAPFQIRGFMIGAYQLLLALGQLISAVATQIVITTKPKQWRPLVATECVFTGVSLMPNTIANRSLTTKVQILILLIWLVPESHLYYARKGDHEKAKRSMMQLYGNVAGYDLVSLISHTLPS